MVENQIVTGAVAHQHIAVAVQKIAAGRLDGNIAGVGFFIVGVALGLHDLNGEELAHIEHHDQSEQSQQECGTITAYSFHASPPMLPMPRIRGYRGNTAAADRTAVRANTPRRFQFVRFIKIPMRSSASS